MNSIQKQEKIEFIKSIIEENLISVYKIAKGTNIRQSTVWNIVKGKTTNPHEVTVRMMYDFLIDQGFKDETNKASEDTAEEISETTDFEKVLDAKIRQIAHEIVQQYVDQKFKEINEHLLLLTRQFAALKQEASQKEKDAI